MPKCSKITVTLAGTRPIMFDRYAGDNKTQLDWREKLYWSRDGKHIVLPAINVASFLSAQNSESAPQRVLGRGWKAVAKAAMSFVEIAPMEIPLLRAGKKLDRNTQIICDQRTARVVKGKLVIPQPKMRPVIDLPWELELTLALYPNPDLDATLLRRLFEEGGQTIGLGTFRGMFGKFEVTRWQME